MKIGEYKKETETYLNQFMKKNVIAKGEVWEQHELKELMEGFLKKMTKKPKPKKMSKSDRDVGNFLRDKGMLTKR